jgi:ATPase subunit of ABC transporter with duplicated ATPase domains
VVGQLDQERRRFEGRDALIGRFIAATALTMSDARSLLAKFGLGAGHVARPAGTLSPGERTRAVLASLMARDVNCLVLDEPTNHLDVPAIEELETALDRYEGTLLIVTHDRELIDRLAVTRAVEVSPDGRVSETEPAAGRGGR